MDESEEKFEKEEVQQEVITEENQDNHDIEKPENSTINKKKKKKKPFIFRFLLGIINFIFILILLIAIWLGVNFFIKTDITRVVPSDYTVHLRTDSVWDSVNPLLDLQAADILLSEPSLASFKTSLIEFRQSSLRENKAVDLVLSRRLDFMLYEDNAFIAVLDTGFLSGIFRLAPVALNFFTVPNLSMVKGEGKTVYLYKAGENVFNILINNNLVIVSSDKELFEKTFQSDNEQKYSEQKKKSFSGKLYTPFAVTADSQKIINMISTSASKENDSVTDYINAVKSCIPEEELASVDFGITDKKLEITLSVPYDISSLSEDSPVAVLLNRNSKIPSIIQRLPEFIQYYTVISAGSLQELKEAAFYSADKSLGLENKWKTAQNLCGTVFKSSLEELFFSWTDDEYAVVGLDQKPDPVFVIKIKNEEKRRSVFDTIFSSIILKNDTSLIIDNVRLPRMQLPDFLQGLLESFGVRLPSPYYMVRDGFIYFSQSPENLAAINSSLKSGTRLTQNSVWKEVSGNKTQYSSLGLFYNLERSIPFFLKSKSSVSKILELYNMGRLDLRTSDSVLEISLSSVENRDPSSSVLAGFPVNLEEKISSGLIKSNIKNSHSIFYSKGDTVVSFDLSSQAVSERKIENLKFIISAAADTESQIAKEKPALWVVTREGTVYLLDEKLKDVTGFPLVTGITPLSSGAATKENLVYTVPDQKFILIGSKRKSSVFEEKGFDVFDLESFDDITTTPVIAGENTFVFYERSFLGGLHVVNQKALDTEEKFYSINGIGFDSPSVTKDEKNISIGFITQSGLLHIVRPSVSEEVTDIQLEGVFYLNAKACGNSFVALSEDGTLFSVKILENSDEAPEVIKIKIPYLTARTGFLSVCDFDNDSKDEIFLCGDGNVIYGFRENLEMIGSFPVTGYGEPLFMDLDGNKKNECICYSLDNKINGWKILY